MPDSTSTTNTSAEDKRQEQLRHNQRVIDLLNSWELEDADEQRETLAFLMRVLDEDRKLLSNPSSVASGYISR